MALCCLLAFWTGGDSARVDQLFRQSDLLREKWDDVHYADGSTYGEKTTERAIANTSEFYDPDTGSGSTETTVTPANSGVETNHSQLNRNRAYLAEKNRLLTDRVAELAAELESKDKLIEALKAELERLKSKYADEPPTSATTIRTSTSCSTEADQTTSSIWERTKTLFGDDTK